METVNMGDHEPLYLFVREDGSPAVYGSADEVNLSVFGDFWRARRDPGAKTLRIMAVTQEDLRELLRGPWSDITHVMYHPTRGPMPMGYPGRRF